MEPKLTLEFLTDDLGFEKIGKWELKENNICYNISVESFLGNECALYAFVVEQKIMYIGKATFAGLKSRLDRYISIGNTKFTNFRCNTKIKEIITSGNDVLIYGYIADIHPCGKSKAIKINLAESLENKLVKILKQQDEANKNYSWNWTEKQLERIEKKIEKLSIKSPSKHSE